MFITANIRLCSNIIRYIIAESQRVINYFANVFTNNSLCAGFLHKYYTHP